MLFKLINMKMFMFNTYLITLFELKYFKWQKINHNFSQEKKQESLNLTDIVI